MKIKRVPPFILVVIFIVINAPALHAQRVSRINPNNITLRAVSLSSLWTGMAVGDSGYVVITHTALTAQGSSGDWALHPSGFDRSITLYAVAYAGDTLHAAIGGSNGSLASTSDGGATWNHISLGTTATIRALTWNKQGVLLGVGDGGLIIRSTDQGQSWKTIPPATTYQLNAISFGTTNDAVAVGIDTAIVQTHDAGQTWTPMAFPYNFHTMYSGQYDTFVTSIDFNAVAMGGADSVWVSMEHPFMPLLIFRGAVGTPNMWWDTIATDMSTQLGVKHTALIYTGMPHFMTLANFTSSDWVVYDTGYAAEPQVESWFPLTAYKVGDADGHVVLGAMRYDGAAIWKEDTTVIILAVGEELSGLDYVWTPHAPAHLMPFGAWISLLIAGTDGTDVLDVNILPNGYGYAVGTDEQLLRTTDSGRTWAKLTLPITSVVDIHATDSAINNVFTLDSSSAIVIGWNGIIYNVAPTGSGFRGVGLSQQERLEGIAFPSKDTGIIVGDFGTILQSTDRGQTWQSIPTNTFQLLYSVAFANPATGVAVGTSGEIERTTDEGNSWNEINNQLTQSSVTFRQVQAFPDGTFLARAGANILRSSDFGQNWNFVSFPSGVGDTAGMSFYSTQIGIVASRLTTSSIIPDTAYFAYTTDGGATWPQFTVPMWAYNQIFFHWLSDHEVLLYGIYGFIEDVTIGENGVNLTRVDNHSSLQIYPNPSSGQVRADYETKANGPVQIELWDEAGKKLATLFSGEEAEGAHEQNFAISNALHGAFFIRLSAGGVTSISKLKIQ